MQIIIYENPDQSGMLVYCYPTGEIPIEQVLVKDCPEGAFIIDEAEFPTNTEKFLDALRLNGRQVYLDMNAAKEVQNTYLNSICKIESTNRSVNEGAGLPNVLAQEQWLALINQAKTNITEATNTTELQEAVLPVELAISANN
jgi:hypothetical protein